MSDEYYSTAAIVLPLAEAVRRRPALYFGSINSLAVNSAIYEAVSNSIDQYLSGLATKVTIEIHRGVIKIIDDGPGLPFDKPSPSRDCSNLAEYYFLNRHDSPTADNHAPHIHIIGGGLGLAIVNAASEWVKVSSSNGSNKYSQSFGKGEILSSGTVENIQSSSGTELEIKLDSELFQGNQPDLCELRKTLFELAHFYPGLVVEFQEERFIARRGLLDLAYIQYSNPPAAWSLDPPLKYFFEGSENNIQVQVAALGETDSTTKFKSWVNGVETVEGGKHISGMITALKNANWNPRLAFIHVIMHDPKFAGPSKDLLRNLEVENVIAKLLTVSLNKFMDNSI